MNRLRKIVEKLPRELTLNETNDVGPDDDYLVELFEINEPSQYNPLFTIDKKWKDDGQAQALAEFIVAMVNMREEVLAALELVAQKAVE